MYSEGGSPEGTGSGGRKSSTRTECEGTHRPGGVVVVTPNYNGPMETQRGSPLGAYTLARGDLVVQGSHIGRRTVYQHGPSRKNLLTSRSMVLFWDRPFLVWTQSRFKCMPKKNVLL